MSFESFVSVVLRALIALGAFWLTTAAVILPLPVLGYALGAGGLVIYVGALGATLFWMCSNREHRACRWFVQTFMGWITLVPLCLFGGFIIGLLPTQAEALGGLIAVAILALWGLAIYGYHWYPEETGVDELLGVTA